jgi:hypothetical protein
MKIFLVAMIFLGPLRAEIVDRVAIAIGYQVISELEIDEELRVTALLNHKAVPHDVNSRRDAADRLIEQFLIQREMQASRYPDPDRKEVDDYAAHVAQDFGGPLTLDQALAHYHLDAVTLRHHLAVQLTTLRFIETRFRPEVLVSDAEVDAFIEGEHRSDPRHATQADRDFVREQIAGKQTDEALAVWLEEARKRFNIIYVDKTLQ